MPQSLPLRPRIGGSELTECCEHRVVVEHGSAETTAISVQVERLSKTYQNNTDLPTLISAQAQLAQSFVRDSENLSFLSLCRVVVT
jgi:hypothetical protein